MCQDVVEVCPENEENRSKQPVKEQRVSVIGIAAALISSTLYSCNIIFIRLIHLPAIEQLLIRCTLQHIILLPVLTYKLRTDPNYPTLLIGNRVLLKFMLIAAVFGFACAALYYEATIRMSPGDVSAIVSSNIFITGILSYFWLKEPYSIADGAFACLAVCGIVLISKPEFIFGVNDDSTYGGDRIWGIALSLLTAVCLSVQANVLRILGKTAKAPASLVLFYYSFCGIIMALIGTFARNSFEYPCPSEFIYIILFVASGFGGQLFINIAFQYERPNTVMVLATTGIIVTLILQVRKIY